MGQAVPPAPQPRPRSHLEFSLRRKAEMNPGPLCLVCTCLCVAHVPVKGNRPRGSSLRPERACSVAGSPREPPLSLHGPSVVLGTVDEALWNSKSLGSERRPSVRSPNRREHPRWSQHWRLGEAETKMFSSFAQTGAEAWGQCVWDGLCLGAACSETGWAWGPGCAHCPVSRPRPKRAQTAWASSSWAL